MLQYELKHAPNEDFVFTQVYNLKRPRPQWLADAPILNTGLSLFYNAFWRLCAERLGGPDTLIPWTAVQRFAEVNCLDDYDTELLHYAIGEMDSVLQMFRRDKAAAAKKAKETADKAKAAARRKHVKAH